MSTFSKSVIAIVAGVLLAASYSFIQAQNMAAIKFSLGKNIVVTARASGVPKFSVRNIDGFVSYSVNGIPADIPAIFDKQGNSITMGPIFAFTMYADRDNVNDLAVHHVRLQFDSASIKDHAAGQKFVSDLIAQMRTQKWSRYVSNRCPAVTGRSSLTDIKGLPNPLAGCALDPDYVLSASEWQHVMKSGQLYQWRVAEVLATLQIDYREHDTGVSYTIFMEFDDFELKRKLDEKNILLELSEGDKNGWKSTELNSQKEKERAELVKKLESDALLRDDTVVQRK